MSTTGDQFQIWATREIERLRREADALELALVRYQGAQGAIAAPTAATATRGSVAKLDRRPRASKYEPLFQLFAEQDRALSLAEMEQIARDMGQPIDRNLLRSTIFIQKKVGRAVPEGERYRWIKPDTETAPPDGGAV